MGSNTLVVRVSVLESQLLLQDALSRYLTASGVELVGCHTEPPLFLSHLTRERPTVAVVGVLLPWVARDLLERILQVHPGQKTILLTCTGDPVAVKACLEAGASAVVDRFSTGCEQLLQIIGAVASAPFGPIQPLVKKQPGPAGELTSLSRRELQVLAHIGTGMDNLKIASLLGISEHTVKVHVGHLYRKLGRENRIEMALLARDLGLEPAT